MRLLLLASLVAILPCRMLAEPFALPISKLGWTIKMDAPAFTEKKSEEIEGDFVFRATSERFNISIFVEPGKIGGNKECYQYYWPLASKNPRISKPTITASNTDKFYRVAYDIELKGPAGSAVTQKNVNYYFAYEGKWVDVHISIINPTKEDDVVIATFDKELSYGK
jgi:hypothetical protein